MKQYTIYSWNVNGIRAAIRKGFLEWFLDTQPDILAIQETKARQEQLQEQLDELSGYDIFWNAAEKPGYSGVASFCKEKPVRVSDKLGIDHLDTEGRLLLTEYTEFTLLNIYFPNGQRDQNRLDYKLEFYKETLNYCENLRNQGKKIIVTGDFNTAHKEIDLRNPKANAKNSGFLPIEREWIDRYLAQGYVDIFRHLHPDEPDHYTWWTYRLNARARNIGWRIDYFLITPDLMKYVTGAHILPDVMGSDHCPISLQLQF